MIMGFRRIERVVTKDVSDDVVSIPNFHRFGQLSLTVILRAAMKRNIFAAAILPPLKFMITYIPEG